MRLPFNISMEEAFEVTHIIQEKDRSFPYCHVLGHRLGAEELKQNPNNWKNIITRCPIGYCNSGCAHGILQERFESEFLNDAQLTSIKKDLVKLCHSHNGWDPTSYEKTECYHSTGHLMMYLSNADIKKSLESCDQIVSLEINKQFAQNCYDGIFMIIYQPLDPEDYALSHGKTPTKDNIRIFCQQFNGRRKDSCLTESWPLMTSSLSNPMFLQTFCSHTDISDRDRCYGALMSAITSTIFKFDNKKIEDFCEKLPVQNKSLCLKKSAYKFIITNYQNFPTVVDFCNKSLLNNPNDSCFKDVTNYLFSSFKPGSKEYDYICSEPPNNMKQLCNSKS